MVAELVPAWFEGAGKTLLFVAGVITATAVIRKTWLWKPLAFAGRSAGRAWRAAFGDPMTNLFTRWIHPFITTVVNESEQRIVAKLDEVASRNDQQHEHVEGELAGVRTELAGVKTRLTLVEDAVRSNIGPIQNEEPS